MTKKQGPGRPPLPPGHSRDVMLRFMAREDERSEMQAAAKRAGETFSGWCRSVLLSAARKRVSNARPS